MKVIEGVLGAAVALRRWQAGAGLGRRSPGRKGAGPPAARRQHCAAGREPAKCEPVIHGYIVLLIGLCRVGPTPAVSRSS